MLLTNSKKYGIIPKEKTISVWRCICMRLELVNLGVIEERFRRFIFDRSDLDDNEKKSLFLGEFRCNLFPQMWGSTTLGFSGIGGSAMTEAYTTVCNIDNTEVYGVFFGEKLAYVVKNPNDRFFVDLREHNMASQDEVERYDSDDTSILRIQYTKCSYVMY